GVLTIYALQRPEPGKFLGDQLDGLIKSTARSVPADQRPPPPREMGNALAWGMFGAQVVSLGMIALVLPRRIGRDWKRQIGLRRPPVTHVFLVALMLPGFLICTSGLAYAMELLGAKRLDSADALRNVFAAWPIWMTVLTVGVGPGVVEELWCRGFLGRGLSARYGLTVGIVLTSLLFALMHLQPAYVLVYGAMGAFLHFTYLASRSIWVPIVLHTLNNGLGAVMYLKNVLMRLDPAPGTVVPVVYLTAFSLLLFGSIAMWTGRVVVRGPKLKDPTFVPEYPGVSAPPPGGEDKFAREETSAAAFTITLIAFGMLVYLLWPKPV
ncbi:MAG TPA: CPBP family intramembrane glutamic endopeptidase, partial [Gemmataceae bacterium]|nr:CPBP family intramembrane glutamic endopeptidase [Gemmataceae bacterium]